MHIQHVSRNVKSKLNNLSTKLTHQNIDTPWNVWKSVHRRLVPLSNFSYSFLDCILNGLYRGSIPEEKYSKSCPDREAYGARGRASSLLPRLTPRTQLRQMHSQATSLLSSTSSFTDSSDDDDEGEELHSYNENKPRRHHYP